jgi:signal transduction histidine kinase
MSDEVPLLQQRIAQLEVERMIALDDDYIKCDLQHRNQQLESKVLQQITELQKTLAELQVEVEKRKQLEQELQCYQQQEQRTFNQEREFNDLKSRFIEAASHEFRTPLAVISSSAGILREFGHVLNEEKRQQHLDCIQVYIKHTAQLLDDILLLNQARAGQLTFTPSPLNFTELCHTIVRHWQLNSPDHVFHLELPVSIEANLDEKLLLQVLTQLFSNATKFSTKGSTVSFRLSMTGSMVIFEIEDQGIGIPADEHSKLFQDFYRARNVGTISGTGLGLSIVKKCVELHGGQVTISSAIDTGTICTVKIPLSSIKSNP